MADIDAGPPLFRHTGRPHIRLSKTQKAVRDALIEKLERGQYRLENVACLCGKTDAVIVSETDRYGLPLKTVICVHCGLLRTNPRLDASSLDGFYANEYRDLYMGADYGDMDAYFLDMFARGRVIVDIIRKAAPRLDLKKADVLEVGCSAGGVLFSFLEAGARVRGIDQDRRYLDYGNKREPALNLLPGGVETLEKEDCKYDIILINHVMEHLADPAGAVRAARKRLKPDGLCYISVPGLKNPAYYNSPTKSFLGSLHIGHLWHFSRQTLERLLKDFEMLYIDDDVRAVCAPSRAGMVGRDFPSEYASNMEFIRSYEKAFAWKLRRAKNVIRNIRHLIKLV